MTTPIVIDMFAGAGGESAGIVPAYESRGHNIELHAINHWERAIETHAANFPWAHHHHEPVQSIDPTRLAGNRAVDLLWASPECTHHSNARGGRPRSDQSRASAWIILKWLQELYIRRVIIENVPEFTGWGPLCENGKVVAENKGGLFLSFIGALQSLGYTVDWRILNAADYGAPTTRRRLFIQAVRDGKQILWPEPTHKIEGWIPASSIIDWSIPGTSIFERKRPLVAATIRRIEHGIRKYWGNWAEPFLVLLRGTGTSRDIHRPVPAITAGGGHIGLVEPLVLNQWGGGEARPVSQPMATVGTTCAHRLIDPFIIKYYGTGEGAKGVDAPLDTVTTKDRFALIEGRPGILDIRFRMFQPHELAAAQGFPAGYIFTGNKTEQVRQIGNAVCPPVALALTG